MSEEEPKGDGIIYGIYTGHNVGQHMVFLFEKQISDKLTDEQLAAEMEQEFPKCKTPFLKRMSAYRNRYNRGDWGCQNGPPGIIILRINHKGEIVENSPGPNPRMSWENPEKRGDDV